MGPGKLSGKSDENVGANLVMDLHPIQGRAKGLVYRLSFYLLLAMLDHIMDALKVQSHLTFLIKEEKWQG